MTQSHRVLLFVLACLTCEVTSRRTRVTGHDINDILEEQSQQTQPWMEMPQDSWTPHPYHQQQKNSSHLEFSSVYLPSPNQQKQKQRLQGQYPPPLAKVSLTRQISRVRFPVNRKLRRRHRSLTDDCRILYESVSSRHYHPMILNPDKTGFLYPTLEGEVRILHIASRTTVLASCPGDKNNLLLNSRPTAYIKCRKGLLYFGRHVVNWSQLGCRKKLRPTLERGVNCGSSSSSSSSSSRRGTTYTILWPIRRGVAIPQIIICFDEQHESVLFTHHQIHGSNIDAKIVETSRPAFKKENLFSISTNTAYSKRKQIAMFNRLLHSNKHLTGIKQHYLARGHLAPDSDFILEPEQDATYYYANVVPQWQSVNNGNWKSLENSIRELAENRGTTLEIWTGTHGILHLPDARNHPVELFLGLTFRKDLIPVPALMWKVVYDPSSYSAVAIVEVNDVRGRGSSSSTLSLYDPPCHDLCSQLPWVDWKVLDPTSGRTFCCSVQDLRRTIPNLPNLGDLYVLSS